MSRFTSLYVSQVLEFRTPHLPKILHEFILSSRHMSTMSCTPQKSIITENTFFFNLKIPSHNKEYGVFTNVKLAEKIVPIVVQNAFTIKSSSHRNAIKHLWFKRTNLMWNSSKSGHSIVFYNVQKLVIEKFYSGFLISQKLIDSTNPLNFIKRKTQIELPNVVCSMEKK